MEFRHCCRYEQKRRTNEDNNRDDCDETILTKEAEQRETKELVKPMKPLLDCCKPTFMDEDDLKARKEGLKKIDDDDDDDDDDTNRSKSNDCDYDRSSIITELQQSVTAGAVVAGEEQGRQREEQKQTSISELHERRENERVRSLAQASIEIARDAKFDWDIHKQSIFMERFSNSSSDATSTSTTTTNRHRKSGDDDDDVVLEINISSWLENDSNSGGITNGGQFFRDYTNINRNTDEKSTSIKRSKINIDVDNLFRNEDRFGDERLKELENSSSKSPSSSKKEIARTTQRECVERLQKLNENIARAWLEADRVAALKLSIKVVKLLGYNAGGKAPEFYPILFFLVTDIADTVGKLVYKRIKSKAENKNDDIYEDEDEEQNDENTNGNNKKKLPDNFNSHDIRESAKATCRNWFFKVASIRELVPRLYLEFALLDCVRFLIPDPPVERVNRLIAQIKGVGDPLISSYLRCYAAKKIVTVLPQKFQKEALKTLFGDFMSRYVAISDHDETISIKCSSSVKRSGMKKENLLNLMNPALYWILSRNTKLNESSTLEQSIHLCSIEFNGNPPLSFLAALFSTLSDSACAENAMRLVQLVKNSSIENGQDLDISSCSKCFIVLGKAFSKQPPREQERLEILKEVWLVLGKWTEDYLESYAGVTDAFVDFVAENFTRDQLEILLKDLARRVKKSRAKLFNGDMGLASRRKIQGDLARNIESICTKILFRFEDISLALSLSSFSYLIDQLGGDCKVSFSKTMLERVNKSRHGLKNNKVINHVFNGAKALHDSLDPLSTAVSDRDIIFNLVTQFVSKVVFDEENIDAELRFLTSCRSAFINADGALIKIVDRAITIVQHVGLNMNSSVNDKKMKAHATSCTAFCQITIPSVENVSARLDLFVKTAKYATFCGLHAQVDGLIRSAIADANDSYISNNKPLDLEQDQFEAAETMHAFILKLSSVLIKNPAGHPEFGPFYAISGAASAIANFPSTTTMVHLKSYMYLSLAFVCSAFAEARSTLNKKNMELYASEQAFVDECCTWAKEMVSKAAEVAFDDDIVKTLNGGSTNLRIAFVISELFTTSSKETGKMLKTLLRRVEASELMTIGSADEIRLLESLKEESLL